MNFPEADFATFLTARPITGSPIAMTDKPPTRQHRQGNPEPAAGGHPVDTRE
jgi:hypothetical protein